MTLKQGERPNAKEQALLVAKDNGRNAGRARRQHDEARARHWTDYQSRYVSAQPAEDRKALVEAFNEGYRETATPPVTPFR
jgi:hypothetical protein